VTDSLTLAAAPKIIGVGAYDLRRDRDSEEMIKKEIARSPIMMVKIKALSFSILRISYSTLFAIFSCSAIAKLEIVGRSSFVINFTYGLFEQTTDLKSRALVA
jgi:hypothetical protein